MGYKLLAYDQSLATLTDLYQLTMAYGYWKNGIEKDEAVFHLFYRKNPFGGGFALAAGLEYAVDLLNNFAFDGKDIEYLATIKGNDGKNIFSGDFLKYLAKLRFSCDIDAIPEGTVIFPHEPVVRVRGPLIQCQLLETALLNIVNFQTLIATKAARMKIAAEGGTILEFGLRRAQGMDGALAASRAAYIGGCDATSNVMAGKLFGIPVKGTHAHSWVMTFDGEEEAFSAYASAMPNNCVFLVDTYDTLEGVKKAVKTGKDLREKGHEMVGIRLDSGDLAYLSIEARKMLDEGGFPKAKIVASNDLDEVIIESLKTQGAKIDIWGVGTKLITAYDQPALGGVYKLSAIRKEGEDWKYKVKLSEQAIKVSNPGVLQVRRYEEGGEYMADLIYDEKTDLARGCIMVDPMDMTRQKKISANVAGKELLVPVFRRGEYVSRPVPIGDIKKQAENEFRKFHPGIKRFVHPHQYPVGLEKTLFALKTELILGTREVTV